MVSLYSCGLNYTLVILGASPKFGEFILPSNQIPVRRRVFRVARFQSEGEAPWVRHASDWGQTTRGCTYQHRLDSVKSDKLPSGNLLHSYGKSPIGIVDLPIIKMVIFHSYVKLPEGTVLWPPFSYGEFTCRNCNWSICLIVDLLD